LDDAQDPGSAGADPREGDRAPAGLRDQLRAVRDAVRRLLTAHIDLAKAEAGEIGAEVKRVAVLAGIALGALFSLALLLPIGLLLFLGEWIFGSIGWGVLLGSFVLIDGAVLAALVAVGVSGGRIGQAFLIALGAGILFLAAGILLHLQARPWVALSVFVALVAWPIAAGYGVARHGIDTDALKARFYPTQTIETTKETIEWVRARTPLGPKS
jgi:hypothetical protein